MQDREWSDVYRDSQLTPVSLIHRKAYDFAKKFCEDKLVLEIGCGSGYGARYIADIAKRVIAIDRDKEAVYYAKNNYPSSKITFVNTNGCLLPFRAECFDTVIAFQFIEHIPGKELRSCFSEMSRVLKSNGTLLLTTPNARFRLLPFQKPNNPYHFREYSPRGLEKSIKKIFLKVEIMGLRANPVIERMEQNRTIESFYHKHIKEPLINLLKFIFPKSVISEIKKVLAYLGNSRKNKDKFNPSYFSLDDLFYTKDYLNKTMDLMAVCKNKKPQ